MLKRTVLRCLALAALLGAPAHADLAGGRAALARGDYAAALEELRPLAESDAEAAYQLATLHRNGWGTPASWAKAALWYKAAAARGHARAQYEYAAALEAGRGVVRDRKAAYDWYRKAAAQGQAAAMTQVGRFHLYGIHRPANIIEARRWLDRAVQAGDPDAQALVEELLNRNAPALDAPGTAKPKEAAARRVLGEVVHLLTPLLGSDGVCLRLARPPTVARADAGHVVTLPMAEVGTAGGGALRLGNVRITFTPDGDDYAVTLALPARASLVDGGGTVVGSVALGRGEVGGRWSTALHTLTDYRAEIADITLSAADGSASLTVAAIRGERTYKPLRPGRHDVVERLQAKDLRFADGRVAASLGGLEYMLQYLDMDATAVAAVAARFGVDWRTGAALREIPSGASSGPLPPMLRDMLVTVRARDLTVVDAAGRRIGGLGGAELSFGGAGLDEALSALSLTYAHQGLAVDGTDAPATMRLNVTADRLPLARLASSAASTGARPPALAALNAALVSARAELRVNEITLEADGYTVAATGQVRPTAAGLAGTLDMRVSDAARLAAALRGGGLEIDPAALPPPAGDLYRLALHADGTVTVNGAPLGGQAPGSAR